MPMSPNQPAPGKLKVLVVEDDQFLQKILLLKFAAEGFEVSGAADGEEALKRILAEAPNIVLLDLILPKMNGFDVLTEIRTNPQTRQLPVIVLSNLGQEEDIRRARNLGALDFLVKSDVSIQEIVQRVKESFVQNVGK